MTHTRSTAQVKPLGTINQTAKTKRPSNSSTATTPTKQAALVKEVPHSQFSDTKSKEYHTNVGNVNTRAIDRLNPTSVVPAHRSYPGIPN